MKAGLRLRGFEAGIPALPLVQSSSDATAQLKALLDAIDAVAQAYATADPNRPERPHLRWFGACGS